MSEQSEHAAWCRVLMYSLAVSGIWGVPRSGLVFKKTAKDTLTLVSASPPPEDFGPGVEEWIQYQRDEYQIIRENFQKAGYFVYDRLEVFGKAETAHE